MFIMKERKSNIELCRIFAILLVVIVHSTYSSLGWPEKLSDTTFLTLMTQSFSIVGVNVFVIITGWFSVVPKKKSLLNLLYICAFYAVINILIQCFDGTFTYQSLLFVSKSNWFIPAYLGLVAISPVLNTYIKNVSKENYKNLLIAMVLFQTWFGFFPGCCSSFLSGYSIISFILLYLLARYFNIYGIPSVLKKYSSLTYCFCSFITAVFGYLLLAYEISYPVSVGTMFVYSNPIVIISAFSLFFSFVKINIKHNSCINHVAKSCLAILLIHASTGFFPYMESYFKYNYTHDTLGTISGGFLGVFTIFVTSVLIDQIRIYSYKFLKKNFKILN